MKKKKLKKVLKKFIPDKYKIKEILFLKSEATRDNQDELYYDLRVYVEDFLAKDELLAKAKRDYPEGTIFEDAHSQPEKGNHVVNCYEWNPVSEGGIYGNNKRPLTYLYNIKKDKWAKIISKPVIKVQDKWLYEGDEYWWVDNNNSWKLFKEKCESKEINKSKCFLTKQAALDYVFVEAKKRFKNNYVMVDYSKQYIKSFKQIQAITDKLNDL
jgi:hypothetical protein